MLRTLDWLNDECEAALRRRGELRHGPRDYVAIMSPVRLEIGRRRYCVRNGRWPISMLVTGQYVVIGTKKKSGRRARVTVLSASRTVSAGAVGPAAGRLRQRR